MGIKARISAFKGYYCMIKGNRTDAYKYLSEAYDGGVKKPAYLTAYGALLMQEGNFEKCREVFEKALDNSYDKPGFIPAITCSIITCRYKMGEKEEALKEAEELWNDIKNSTTYVLYGYLLMAMGRIDDALKINTEAFEYDDEDVAICDNLAQTYYSLGDMENAKKYFERAVSIKYNMVDSCYFLSRIYIQEGELKKAYNLLEDAKDAPFNALTTVTKEELNRAFDEIDKIVNSEK